MKSNREILNTQNKVSTIFFSKCKYEKALLLLLIDQRSSTLLNTVFKETFFIQT